MYGTTGQDLSFCDVALLGDSDVVGSPCFARSWNQVRPETLYIIEMMHSHTLPM